MNLLVVFDFDHTLIDRNTDMDVTDLVPELRLLQKNFKTEGKGWAYVMSEVLKELHRHGKTKEEIKECILKIEFVEGMRDLLDTLVQTNQKDINVKVDIIIVSHSNTYFIDILLNRENLKDYFKEIHTFPAAWEAEGFLVVNKYHDCVVPCEYELCPKDFCKGLAMSNILKELKDKTGFEYDKKIYIGDGTSDLCACLKFDDNDIVFCREGYSLHKLIEKHQPLKAKYVTWTTGHDICQEMATVILQINSEK